MGKTSSTVESIDKKLSVSRRGFLKGAIAAGGAAALYGCSKGNDSDVVYSGGGSSGGSAQEVYTDDLYYTDKPTYRYGSSCHNCGGRCIIKAQVTDDGRIVRFLTDDTKYAYDGTLIDNNYRNSTQARACSRCRAYKGRLYHPGRLKYPLKQTKERGDMSGFKRITWEQALSEISSHLHAVQDEYGATAFHSIYACGNIASSFQGGGYTGVFAVNDLGTIAPALRALGGCTGYTSDYSFHQGSYMGAYGTAYSGMINMPPTPDQMALNNEHFVMWGSNIPTTHNPKAYAWVKSIEDMKKRRGEFPEKTYALQDKSVIFIGPELSEVGISQADTWIQTKPYTDVALINGMLWYMLDKTLRKMNGEEVEGEVLDFDYIDTMVYGFFDSPGYWIADVPAQYNTATTYDPANPDVAPTSAVSLTDPGNPYILVGEGTTMYRKTDTDTDDTDAGTAVNSVITQSDYDTLIAADENNKKYYTKVTQYTNGTTFTYAAPVYKYVAPVPDGKSLSAYLLGTADSRLASMPYGNTNFLANMFSGNRNRSVSTYASNTNSKFAYKKELGAAKDLDWASKKTGINKETIKELAELYLTCGAEGKSVYNEWAGGQLKQNDGCITLFALQTLLILTKNWGLPGTGIANNTIGVQKTTDPNQITAGQLSPAGWTNGDIPFMPFHPKPSVTQWHNAIKFAFGTELKANGYKPNIPDWTYARTQGKPAYKGESGEVYFDDGGTKALVTRSYLVPVAKADRLMDSTATTDHTFTVNQEVRMPDETKQSVPHTYYDYDGGDGTVGGGTPKFAGFRFILNSAGNIPINQHANPIDSARMYKALPTFGYENGSHNVDEKDAFYLVTFDNFMSPSARYSDYVLPAKTTWEQEDFVAIENSGNLYIDSVIPGPGESKSSWDFAREWIKVYSGAAMAKNFAGLSSESSFKNVVQKVYNDTIRRDPDSPFYNKTWDEFLEKPISHAKPNNDGASADEFSAKNGIRALYDARVEENANPDLTTAFYPGILSVDATIGEPYPNITFGFCGDPMDTGGNGFAETASCPNQSGRFHVYSGSLVWRYENLFSKWHGYLPKAQQGQINKDYEGDPLVYPIPLYMDYEDHFRVAYGLNDNSQLSGRYLLTTTHDRFRAHSSQAENPYLRELTHRVQEGELYSGNDYKYYAVLSDPTNAESDVIPPLNSLIGEDGKPLAGHKDKASYADIWVNKDDFANLKDGTLVKVENEIGRVYCTIRKTDRCVKGYVGLHQGCWFDPRGDVKSDTCIDVGGNCNTLMPSTPSRMDHGNGVQSAYVKITPVA